MFRRLATRRTKSTVEMLVATEQNSGCEKNAVIRSSLILNVVKRRAHGCVHGMYGKCGNF